MWKKILGHRKQIEQLAAALQQKKTAHAYLFSGIEGIGKKQTAIGLAQGLNCPDEKETPCGHCLSCQKIANGTHPDCTLIEPAGTSIKIDVIRELKQKIYLHPLEGKAKVVLIDQAEAMTEAAANALLKILEEPPRQTFFILISARPMQLLPTIRSRCQRLEFNPLTEQTIAEKLMQEKMPKEEALKRAEISGGSLTTALQFDLALLEQTKEQLKQLGKKPAPSQIFNLSEMWADEEEKLPLILNALDQLWHRQILHTEDGAQMEKAVAEWGALQNVRRGLEGYANKQLLLENLLFRLTR